jgi:hydroxymethylpyrimidine/phosphomethylpyrimidine kinase
MLKTTINVPTKAKMNQRRNNGAGCGLKATIWGFLEVGLSGFKGWYFTLHRFR